MFLEKLTLDNFRPFTRCEFDFSSQTLILGGNGTGKSSVIEAIRLLSVGKSFRTSKIDECISLGQAFLRISADLKADKKKNLELFYGLPLPEYVEKEKHLTLNDKEQNFLEFLGQFPSVIFTPSDIDIVLGSPQQRRRYLDAVLWQVDKEFRHLALSLSKTLKERSTALFLIKIKRASLEELTPWNEILTDLTQKIRAKRRGYVEFLEGFLSENGERIDIKIAYEEGEKDLEKVATEEIRLSQNLYGPHRDELEININNRSGRRFASRGQARTAAVLLKLGEAWYLKQKLTQPPLMLLDDLFSELDKDNSSYLIAMVEKKYQVIATSTQENSLVNGWSHLKL